MKYEQPIVAGIDSETNEGPPITLQVFSGDQPSLTKLLWVDEKDCADKLLRHLSLRCKPGNLYVFYGHYLPFDFASFFWPQLADIVKRRDSTFDFTYRDWHIRGVYGTPTFAHLESGDRRVMIVDAWSWFRCSLAKAADLVCPELPKLERMADLGKRAFKKTDSAFVDYAMRDAEVSYRVGKTIDAMHERYDLSQSVSVADMAARIFRKHYVEDPICRTGPQITQAAVLSYHGGKNNMLGDAAPAWHRPVTSYDISSAYPYAMTQLPSFTKNNCFGSVRVFPPRSRKVPDIGIYRISGRVADCAWPSLFGHDFKPLRGRFENVWVHGYELNEALRTGEVRLSAVSGYIYDVERDPGQPTAFSKFVREFYDLKSSAESPVHRFLYKVILNSISGKFIQTRDVEVDLDGKIVVERHASGLFHPFIASSITAHTRATIHRLEHHASALHTATDGIFAPGKARHDFDFAPKKGLGSISVEAEGELCLLRNKCYLLQTRSNVGYPSFYRKGWHTAKLAMHGFQGSPKQFEELIFNDRRKYSVERPYRLREAIKSGHVPNKFIQRALVLKVPPLRRLFDYA